MKYVAVLATALLFIAPVGHASDFVCPDEKSEELRMKAGQTSSAFRRQGADLEETIAALQQVVAEARLPQDREGYQSACNSLAGILIDENLVDTRGSVLDGCPNGLVGEILERDELFKGVRGDPPYLPIVWVEPVFPAKALEEKLSGWVIVEFTVTRKGTTDSVTIVESSDEMFEWPALKAAEKLRYKPRKNKKKKVNTPGVRNWYLFDYEETVWNQAERECRRRSLTQ